jgi:hypothetical protein
VLYWEDLLVAGGVLLGLGGLFVLVACWTGDMLAQGRGVEEPPRACAVCGSAAGRVSAPRWGYPSSHAVCRSRLRRHPELNHFLLQ